LTGHLCLNQPELVRVVAGSERAPELLVWFVPPIQLSEEFPDALVIEILLKDLFDQACAVVLVPFLVSFARLIQQLLQISICHLRC
jgi:hypothetical protein